MANERVGHRNQERPNQAHPEANDTPYQHGKDQKFTQNAPDCGCPERTVSDKAKHHRIECTWQTHPGDTGGPDAKPQCQHCKSDQSGDHSDFSS